MLRKHRRAGGPHEVLVVEDDPSSREMLGRALETGGWQVSEAANGRVALELLDEHPPTLIPNPR